MVISFAPQYNFSINNPYQMFKNISYQFSTDLLNVAQSPKISVSLTDILEFNLAPVNHIGSLKIVSQTLKAYMSK